MLWTKTVTYLKREKRKRRETISVKFIHVWVKWVFCVWNWQLEKFFCWCWMIFFFCLVSCCCRLEHIRHIQRLSTEIWLMCPEATQMPYAVDIDHFSVCCSWKRNGKSFSFSSVCVVSSRVMHCSIRPHTIHFSTERTKTENYDQMAIEFLRRKRADVCVTLVRNFFLLFYLLLIMKNVENLNQKDILQLLRTLKRCALARFHLRWRRHFFAYAQVMISFCRIVFSGRSSTNENFAST